MRSFARFVCLGTVLAVLSCAEPQGPLNVVFVLVDTLRADHLGVYGYERETSPWIDAFAAEAVFFENARSQSACTFPSVNSMLTSRSPIRFLGQRDVPMGIPRSTPSLAEMLRHQGYGTIAVSASAVVRNKPSRINQKGGFGRGFDLFLEDCTWQPAACVNQAIFPYLKKGSQPLFLYLHYIDPHGPYQPPKAFRRKFLRHRPTKDFILRGNPNPIGDMIYKGTPDPGATPEDLEHLIDLYDAEIAYFDSRFKLLVAALKAADLWDDSIVVFAADHGEDFLEHGHIKHCRTVYDTSIRTPLILKLPGVSPRKVTTAVQNLDIVPTLLDYLDIPADAWKLEGRSLRPYIEKGGERPEVFQQAAMGALRSTSDGRHKLIHDLAAGSFALFDLVADPAETFDVLAGERRSFHRLRKAMGDWIESTEGSGRVGESLRKADEAEARLRALGYLE